MASDDIDPKAFSDAAQAVKTAKQNLAEAVADQAEATRSVTEARNFCNKACEDLDRLTRAAMA